MTPVELQIITGLVTFLGGLLAGHWLSLHRDRRKDFNDTAEPLKLALRKEREMPGSAVPYAEGISAHQAASMAEQMGRPWKRRQFEAVYREYARARTEGWTRDDLGQVSLDDTERLRRAIDGLLRLLTHR